MADSNEAVKIKSSYGAAELAFNFVAPPQVDENRLFLLARYHFGGFFYWITYQHDEQRGYFVPGDFWPVAAANKRDWGNERIQWFTKLWEQWDIRVHAITADGFFKFVMRRHPDDKKIWGWALEWNQNTRIIGLAGDTSEMARIMKDAPTLNSELVYNTEKDWLRIRVEKPADPASDKLFSGT